jgi:acyl homoserine lactone synthase
MTIFIASSIREAKMILLVTPDRYGDFTDALAAMHQLRHRVFKARLRWEVETAGSMEVDKYDALRPHYLLLWGTRDRLLGCVRFLPGNGPTMLRDTFPALLPQGGLSLDDNVWESSRFALDFHGDLPKAAAGLAAPTYELLAGMVEFGLARGLSKILTVTDVRMERILRRATWPLERVAPPQAIGVTKAVAGYLEVSLEALARLRSAGGFSAPVLWTPVLNRAA